MPRKTTRRVKGEASGKHPDRLSCPKIWTSMGMHSADPRHSWLLLPLLVIDPSKGSKNTGNWQVTQSCCIILRGPTTTSPAHRSRTSDE
ncbi:predicted protein [Botrytis cinerea T4]|uniref:Uncharacterized protein n=1 Tax=Botryotinia fuckeliana (strain T4) TaxID=999810 RepID=G2YFQ1_BOTF4|nr:predicted protein [Botrytis cinerea T4]